MGARIRVSTALGLFASALAIAALGASCNSPDAVFGPGSSGSSTSSSSSSSSASSSSSSSGLPASPDLVPLWKIAATPQGEIRGLGFDTKRNVVVVGAFGATLDFGGSAIDAVSAADLFFGRLGPTGKQLSLAAYSGQDDKAPWYLAMDGDRSIWGGWYMKDLAFGAQVLTPATGNPLSRAFVTAFDADQPVWAQGYGPSQLELVVYGVAVDPRPASRAVFIVGTHQDKLDLGGTPELAGAANTDMYIAKLDVSGNALWSKSFGDMYEQQARRVAADPQGNAILVGYNGGTVDFGGGPLASNDQSLVAAKFGPDGQLLWSKQFGGDNHSLATGVACDANGDIVIAGTFSGTLDFGGGKTLQGSFDDDDMFVVKLSPDGSFLWGRLAGGTLNQYGNALALDPDGNVLVAGDFQGSTSLGGPPFNDVSTCGATCYDIFIAKLAPDGTHLWSRGFGNAGEENVQAIAAGPDGLAVLGGYFELMVDFGDGKPLNAPDGALFVVEYGPKK